MTAAPDVAPVPVKRKGTRVFLLSLLMVVLLAAAGVSGALYFSAKSDRAALTAQLAEKDKQLADRDRALLGTSLQEHTDSGALITEKEANLTLGVCHQAVVMLRNAIDANDDAKIQAGLHELYTDCA